jgi:hypothetical protein
MTPPGACTEGSADRVKLTRSACLALLAPGGRGRVAATMRALPVIIPVSFTFDAGEIIFGGRLDADVAKAVAGSVIAFETDHIGPDGLIDWDVHVTGVARAPLDQTGAAPFRLAAEIISGWCSGEAHS